MTLHPPALTDWVADFGATNHTTPNSGNISRFHPLHSNMPSSIIVGNGSILLVTSVGDSVLLGPLYLNNILIAQILFRIFYLFINSPLTIRVQWNLTHLISL
jgi:hypothetical protein